MLNVVKLMIAPLILALIVPTALAFMEDMVVVDIMEPGTAEDISAATFLVPNHPARNAFSMMMNRRGKSHSFHIQDTLINFNCKAGFKTGCGCSMEITHGASKILKNCVFQMGESVRDEQGNCLVHFFKNGKESFGDCVVKSPDRVPSVLATLKPVPSLGETVKTFIVPRQPAGWGVHIDKVPIAIKCDDKDDCHCSVTLLTPSIDKSFETFKCLFEPVKRDSSGHCAVTIYSEALASFDPLESCSSS